jgi:hypothetical protein
VKRAAKGTKGTGRGHRLLAPTEIYEGGTRSIELAHEVARGIELVVEGQRWPPGKCRVEDSGIGLRQQQAGGATYAVADDFAGRRIRRVFGVTDRSQRRSIQERTVVKMKQENRRIRRDGVQLSDGEQAFLGELMLGETAGHPHPLRRWCHRYLAL